MIEWIKFRWGQWRIQRGIDKNSRDWRAAEKKARAKGANADELHELGYSYHFEQLVAEDEMIRLNHRYYVRLANRLLVPVPEFKSEGGGWKESEFAPNHFHLSPDALHELRTAIHTEKKARREAWGFWVTILVGLIGALTGFVAVLKD